MKKILAHLLTIFLLLLQMTTIFAQDFRTRKNIDGTWNVAIDLDQKTIIHSPTEGLWSISTNWTDDWMNDWHFASPSKIEEENGWIILKGQMKLPNGTMVLRDAYKENRKGLIHCIRRFQWLSKDTLKKATLSIRYKVDGTQLKPFLPGIIYYGNPSGSKINKNAVPSYTCNPGEFAIFEDHRFPMPFTMLENAKEEFGVAIHTVPSRVKGAILPDQWWSMGIETKKSTTDLVLYSGPIGYNGHHSVAKALQGKPMKYNNTYINIEPGKIIEKEYYLETFPVLKKGTGFETPLYTSINLYKPFDAERFKSYKDIINSKMNFCSSRWLNQKNGVGYDMYNKSTRKEIVMGWCGQAGSPGYALQWLRKYCNDKKTVDDRIQHSLDFLTTFPIKENGVFNVCYNLNTSKYSQGDHVSCGEAMYNMAKAIASAKINKRYNTNKWETYLKKICDLQAKRILDANWSPYSTAEAFYIAPLCIASKLFHNNTYKKAAIKAGNVFAEKHLSMDEPYWGGTLDATCEDKEGAWAAFQGFINLYEYFGDKKNLYRAKHAMDVCLSYLVIWDIPLPAGRLSDHNFKSTGWTVVSPQNQHIDVFGVFFSPDIYKMGIYLKNEKLKKIAKVMYRSCAQLTDIYGSQGEQVQQTNFAQNGDLSNVFKLRGGYSENWTVFWVTAHFLNAAARFEEIGVQP